MATKKTPEQIEQERLLKEQQRQTFQQAAASVQPAVEVPKEIPAVQAIPDAPREYDSLDQKAREENMKVQQRSALQSAASSPTFTAESIAKPQQVVPERDFVRDQMVASGAEAMGNMQDYILSMKKDDEQALKESEAQVKADQRAAEFTGYAELASAIANLVGVGGYNAVSQQHKNFSQGWMQKADQDLREHRNRLQNIRDRQRDMEYKLNQLRQQNGLQLAQYDAKKRQQDIENAMAARKAQLDEMFKRGELDVKQYQAMTDRLKAQATDEYNKGRLANDNIKARASAASSYSTAARNYAQAERYKKMDDKSIDIDLAAFGDEPEEKLHIDPNGLIATIKSNINSINLSQEEKARVDEIMENDKLDPAKKAEAMMSLVGTNPDVRRLARRNASSVKRYKADNSEEETTNTATGSRSFWD